MQYIITFYFTSGLNISVEFSREKWLSIYQEITNSKWKVNMYDETYALNIDHVTHFTIEEKK